MDENKPERRVRNRREEDVNIPWDALWHRGRLWISILISVGTAFGAIAMVIVGTTSWMVKLDNRINENSRNIGQVAGVMERTVEQLQICRENSTKTAVVLDTLMKSVEVLRQDMRDRQPIVKP